MIGHPAYTGFLDVAQNLPGMHHPTEMINFFEHTNLSVRCLRAAPVAKLLPRLDAQKVDHHVVMGTLACLCFIFKCDAKPVNKKYKAIADLLRCKTTYKGPV